MALQEDLDRIDVMLRQLQVKWDLFFNGSEKKPPIGAADAGGRLIKRHSNAEIRNNGDRFRFQGLTARYTTFNELWQKKLRAREEGRLFGMHGLKAEKMAPPRPPAQPVLQARGAPGVPRDGSGPRHGGRARALREIRRRAPPRGESRRRPLSTPSRR